MIIWPVNKSIYEEFIAPDTGKNSAHGDRLKRNSSDQFLCSLLIRAHVSLLLLVNGRRSWQPDSRETRHKSLLPEHTSTSSSSSSSLPSCILCESAHQHVCFVAWSGKMALNQRTTNHRQALVQFQQSLVSTCRHTYAHTHTSQTELSGLCSHQCVQLDRERKMGEIVEGVRRSN